MLIRFGSIGENSTRDTLLGEVHQEWSNHYGKLGRSPLIAPDTHKRDQLICELEMEYSNKI
jgi:hypothetical protein